MSRNNIKPMSKDEKNEWDNLYQYVKREILMYDDNQAIPSSFCLRLKGLKTGKYIENKNQDNKANYNFNLVLKTFKLKKKIILSAIQNKEFDTEFQKFNYILKIVENSLNDTYQLMQKKDKALKKIEDLKLEVIEYQGAKYQRKTKESTNNKLKDLW